jgi:hypothetical protein
MADRSTLVIRAQHPLDDAHRPANERAGRIIDHYDPRVRDCARAIPKH